MGYPFGITDGKRGRFGKLWASESQDRLDTGPSFSSLAVGMSTPLPSVPGPGKWSPETIKMSNRGRNQLGSSSVALYTPTEQEFSPKVRFLRLGAIRASEVL